MDKHSKEVRSYNMSQVKSKDTKPELLVRKFLFSKGFRYRLHNKKLPGTPDIVLSKYKTVILINGCFWHGHEGCKYYTIPKTRTNWWIDKINRNIDRDVENKTKLQDLGWKIIEIWECELKVKARESTLEAILQKIKLVC
ncbi:DNA mismatch endonuclease Vsr [Chryseobacterium sp. SSA4.19]|uniref:very short patch repair endonuclease n=1 Tax=Chryseobacterium sp. SSA4.19 TaxID=2919915 RepID=UPI001F4D713E|nr:DNA mismatch endonuclease Vsr [Chryseobacterium sp. SSA4.19]